jgi:hypothetical protein
MERDRHRHSRLLRAPSWPRQPRLDEFVRRGGTLIVQYQSGNFPAPFPLSMGRMAERVVDETAPVKLLDPAHPLLTWPNAIRRRGFRRMGRGARPLFPG